MRRHRPEERQRTVPHILRKTPEESEDPILPYENPIKLDRFNPTYSSLSDRFEQFCPFLPVSLPADLMGFLDFLGRFFTFWTF